MLITASGESAVASKAVDVSTPTQHSSRNHRSRTRVSRTRTAVSSSPPVQAGCWCFGRRNKKSVRFAKNHQQRVLDLTGASANCRSKSRQPLRSSTKGLQSVERRLSGSEGVTHKSKLTAQDLSRSSSKQSFYSACSTYSRLNATAIKTKNANALATSPETPTTVSSAEGGCVCGFQSHSNFDPQFPLVTSPGVAPGSREEMELLIKPTLGRWITILNRSESLDPQMVILGISKMKRMVMNKLVVPFTARMNGDIYDTWITTPLGEKHSTCDLNGNVVVDLDSDVGEWTSKVSVIDYSTPAFCNGKPIRALQLQRHSDKIGEAYEVKVVVPDDQEGRILLYEIDLRPKTGAPVRVLRVYKFVGN